MATTSSGAIPATAKIMWGQSTASQAAGYYGNHYFNMGPQDPDGYIPGLLDYGGPTNGNTAASIAVFDPTPLGVASVYQHRNTNAEVSSNIFWLWDLQAIAAASGGTVIVSDAVVATLELTVLGSHAPTGSLSPAVLHVANTSDPRFGALVEPAVAPHVLTTEHDPNPTGLFDHWFATPYAWAEPAIADPGRPDTWSVVGVGNPAVHWGSQWASLMTPGGPVGSVMRMPRMPIRPLSFYQGAGLIPAGTTGTWTAQIPLGNTWLADGRWLGVWVSTDAQAQWIEYQNVEGAQEPVDDIESWWDFDVTAYLTFPILNGPSTIIPPLQQAARLIGNVPLLQRSREVRTQRLTARGRF